MPLTILEIVRDCYWVNISGTPITNAVWVNENDEVSSLSTGLYKSISKSPLDDNDSIFIKNQVGTKTQFNYLNSPNYTFRVKHDNIVPEQIQVSVRGAAQSGLTTGMKSNFLINGKELASDYPEMVGDWDSTTPTTYTKVYSVTDDLRRAILGGRIDDQYDYVSFQLSRTIETTAGFDTKDFKVFGIEVAYSGVNDWDNYSTSNPNLESQYYYPDKVRTRGGDIWVSNSGTPVASSDFFYVNQPASGVDTDSTYIKHDFFLEEGLGVNTHTHTNWDYHHDRSFGGNSPAFTNTANNVMPSGGIIFHYSPNLPVNSQVHRARLSVRLSLPPSGLYDNIRDTWEVEGYNEDVRNNHDGICLLGSSSKNAERNRGYILYGAGDIVENSGFQTQTVELNFLEPGLLGTTYNIASIKHRNVDIFENLQLHFKGLPSGTCLSTAELVLDTYDPQGRVELYCPGGVTRQTDTVVVDSGVYGLGYNHHVGNYNEENTFNVGFFKFNELSGTTTNAVQSGVFGTLLSDTSEYWHNYYRKPIAGFYHPNNVQRQHYRNALIIPSSGLGGVDFQDRLDTGSDDFGLYFYLSGSGTASANNLQGTLYWRGDSAILDKEMSIEYDGSNNLTVEMFRDDLTYETLTVNNSNFKTYFHHHLLFSFIGTSLSGQMQVWNSHNGDSLSLLGSSSYFTRGTITNSKTYIGNAVENSEVNNLVIHEFGVSNSGVTPTNPFFESRISTGRFLLNGDVDLEWTVPYGSGTPVESIYTLKDGSHENDSKIYWNTTYKVDNWKNNITETLHSLSTPTKSSYNRLNVTPSSIYITGSGNVNTDHPSGLLIRAKLRYNSGSDPEWKVWQSNNVFVPSGSNQVFTMSLDKEFGLDDSKMLYSNVDDVFLDVHTEFTSLNPTDQFYGEVNLSKLNLVFDNWYIPATGVNALTLYASGSPATPTGIMDLYLHNNKHPGEIDLFVEGHVPSSGEMTLYTIAGAKTNTTTLFLANYWSASNAEFNLFTSGKTWPYHSGNTTLFTYSTTNSGLRDSVKLFTGTPENRAIPEYAMNMYLHSMGTETVGMNLVMYNDNVVDSGLSLFLKNAYTATNSGVSLFTGKALSADGSQGLDSEIPLYIARSSESTSHIVPMYLKAGEQSTSNFNLYVFGASGYNSNVTMYVSGAHIPNANFKLYTHGF